jgi:hypothetical protein
MSTITNTAPGLTQPTMIGMQAGNPKDSAIASQNQMNTKQASLNSAVGGRRKRRGGAIAVPQFQMQYTPQGGQGQDPNALIQQNSQTSTQSVENASMDSGALIKQGGNKGRKGGNPDWIWGCYSGGKSRNKRSKRNKRNKRIKTRKNRKTRRTRK